MCTEAALHAIIGVFHAQIEIYSFIRTFVPLNSREWILVQRGKPTDAGLMHLTLESIFDPNCFSLSLDFNAIRYGFYVYTCAHSTMNDIVKSSIPILPN